MPFDTSFFSYGTDFEFVSISDFSQNERAYPSARNVYRIGCLKCEGFMRPFTIEAAPGGWAIVVFVVIAVSIVA